MNHKSLELCNYRSEIVLPPWVFGSEFMYPLLVAYDQRIADADTQVRTFTEKIEQLETSLNEVTKENGELHEKMKSNVAQVLRKVESDIPVVEPQQNSDW